MRKILYGIITAFILAQPVMAEFVRPEVAARYAQGFLGMKKSPEPEQANTMRAQGRDAWNADPEYYVFNNPDGGWAIIAADDRVNPVIGYSPEGSFVTAGMPENLQWWMDGVADLIDNVRKSGGDAPESVRAAWESLQAGVPAVTEGNKRYIETALWSQSEPYNDMCPIVNGETKRSLTGCVATAMAIIMQSNRWPSHGKGVIGGYTTSTNETYIPAVDTRTHTYDWDIMSDAVVVGGKTESWTPEQKDQVAQLMHDCGVAVKMDYSCEASSALSGDMLKAIQKNMYYSDKATLVSRASYKLDKWFSLLKNEIDHGRVAYYGAVSDAGGHAFVCDGYDNDSISPKLRINWGWGGSCNGYYTLDLTIYEDYNFTYMQEAIIGLAPDTAVVEMEDVIDLVMIRYDDFYGIAPANPADITVGSEVSFKVGWFMSNSNHAIAPEFKICLEDKDGNIKQRGWDLIMKIPAFDGYIYSDETDKAIVMEKPLLTDRFRLYITDGKGGWKPMPGNYDILPDVDGVVCGVVQDPIIIVTPEECTAGQEVELSLSLGFTHVRYVMWNVNGTSVLGNKVQLVKGKNVIRADVSYLDGSRGSIYRTLELE